MTLRADNLQAAGRLGRLVQLDVRTAPGHVGGNRDRPVQAGIGNNLRLHLVELGVQHVVRDAFLLQHLAK